MPQSWQSSPALHGTCVTRELGTPSILLGEHPQPSSAAPKPIPCGALRQILGCAKCLRALVPVVHPTELSCGRAWLPFCLVMQFIASVLPSMHQFLIQIQTQVKVSPVI